MPENCFLIKKIIQKTPIGQQSASCLDLEEELGADVSAAEVKSDSITTIWEYHILYNISYSVPVLYFNVRDSAGKLLPLEKVWETLKVPEKVLLEKWSFVTQQEHPVFRRPFYYLHPCKSFELFRISENSKVNPLVTWLSSVAPIVHLHVPLDYAAPFEL